MVNNEPVVNPPENQEQRSEAWKTAVTVIQEAKPPHVPEGAEVMTVMVEFPPETPAHLRTGTSDRPSATCWRARCCSSWRESPSG